MEVAQLTGSLSRKVALMLYGVLTITSVLFLVFLFGAYQLQLKNERAHASSQLNLLLGAALENAMLKRDLEGLNDIIKRLASQSNVIGVDILNPQGVIRFASDPTRTGKTLDILVERLCDGCSGDFAEARITTHFLDTPDGGKILRSVNPVHNKPQCRGCHGSPKEHPVNGLLVVDYDATPILHKAWQSLLFLLCAGFIVMALTLGTVAWFIRRYVLQPVSELQTACRELGQGNLDYRPEIRSDDEFGELSRNFNLMAQRLQQSLDQLLEKEAYLQALIDAIPDGIRVIDKHFKTIHVNKAFADILKMEQKSLSGTLCYESSCGRDAPCTPTLVTCPVDQIERRGRPIKTIHEYLAADGTMARVQVFAAPMVIEEHGEISRYVVESARDLMKDIHFSHEQKLSALGQLAAGVGHEIRNPLSSIRLAMNQIMRKLHKNETIDPQVVEYLGLVDEEIDACLDITGRLLKMSSLPDEGSQPIDVHRAIGETVSLLRYEGEQKGIGITLSIPEELPRILATETDIRMVILNLVQNAFHAMPQGGELMISGVQENGKIIIDICDNGAGIANDILPHIFEPFFTHRADGQQGIGLGLTICRSLLERYHGTIEVAPAPAGFVTCFRISLPATTE